MPVSREEVLHIAALARFRLDDERVDSLARELSSILQHIEVLASVSSGDPRDSAVTGTSATPLRRDSGPPPALDRPLESFAPEMKQGFFVVPRLSTHEDSTGGSE